MAVSREAVLKVLWSLVPDDASPEAAIRVSPEALAAALECTREEAGQLLTDLGAGRTRAKDAAGIRTRWRTITVQQLGARPQAPETAPTAPVGRPLAEGPPPHGPHVDTHCKRCFTGLPDYLQYIGVCGDCLQDAQQEVRSVPGPCYGCVADAQAQHAEPGLDFYQTRGIRYGGR